MVASVSVPSAAEPVEVGQSMIAVPLTARGRVLGALMVGGEPDRVYTGDEQHLLTVFGDQAALALHNAQLFTETERARRLAERLAGVARSVPQSVTLSEIGRQVADGLRSLFDARESVVYRLDPASWSLERVAASPAGEGRSSPDAALPLGSGFAGVAASTRQPVVTADVLAETRANPWAPDYTETVAHCLHTILEEEIFYPAVEGKVDEDLLKESFVEHDAAKVLIAEIEAGEPSDDFFDSKVKVLKEQIEHHVEEEEMPKKGLFAQARGADLDMKAVGDQLARRKAQLQEEIKSTGLPAPETTTLEEVDV